MTFGNNHMLSCIGIKLFHGGNLYSSRVWGQQITKIQLTVAKITAIIISLNRKSRDRKLKTSSNFNVIISDLDSFHLPILFDTLALLVLYVSLP